MFQAYQYLNYLGRDPGTDQHRYEYEIFDSDFEEIASVSGLGYTLWIPIMLGIGIIDIYQKKQLPVPINLALAFKYLHDQSRYVYKDIISLNRKYNPEYKQYAKETEKCLQCLMKMKAFG